jgi:hypothetical protein
VARRLVALVVLALAASSCRGWWLPFDPRDTDRDGYVDCTEDPVAAPDGMPCGARDGIPVGNWP